MNLSDHDIELLDRYLDGDLADAELIGLEARLKVDAAMSGELSKLREFRALRVQAFASLEPSETESQQLQWYVRGALNQHTRETAPVLDTMGAWMRGLSRVAAVLVVGFVVGYFYRGGATAGPGVAGPGVAGPGVAGPGVAGPAVVAQNSTLKNPAIDVTADGPPAYLDRNITGLGGTVTPVSNLTGGPTGYEVALTDQNGTIVARQQFRSLQEARDFAAEIGRLQQKQRQLQSSGVRLIGDDF